jgi:hypothetical protein
MVMADRLTEDAVTETAEMAFRRITRRKLVERGFAEDQIEAKIVELMRKGANLRINVDEILRKP